MANYIIKLGGSIICDDVDKLVNISNVSSFISKLKEVNVLNGDKFIVATGGGSLMRKYRDILKPEGVEDKNIHWIGTTVCVLNAMIVKSMAGEIADEEVIKFEDFYNDSRIEVEKVMKLAGAGRPGHSSDVDAVIVAQKSNSKVIYSLKNIDGVYSADPKKDPNAIRKDKITWMEYFDIIGWDTKFTPGANFPIDPVASRMAMENGLKFVVVLGSDMENFSKALKGENFIGTIVG